MLKEQVAKIYSLLLWNNKWGYSSRPTFKRLRYYWIAKIRRLALEELPRKRNGIHSQPDRNTILLPEASSGFTEVSLPDKQTPHSSLAAVLQPGDMRIEIFEDTSSESLTKILKAVQSC